MTAGDTSDRQPWWKPAPLSYVMAALAAWCTILGWIGLHGRVTGNDAAGNGMATGFLHGFAQAGLEFTAFLVGLYLLCRWRPLRHVCVTLLVLLSLVMVLLVR